MPPDSSPLHSSLDERPARGLILAVVATKPRRAAEPGTHRRWTFEELAAEVPESNRPMELWDGELIMSPSPSYFHQEVVIGFHDSLRAWVWKHGLGKTGIAPLDLILTRRRVVQPDVFFVSGERAHSRLLRGFQVSVAELFGTT